MAATDWPNSAADLDGRVYDLISQHTTKVLVGAQAEVISRELDATLTELLSEVSANSTVLITTSTTGKRPTTHELPAEYIRIIGETVANHPRVGRTLIGDGPAYGAAFQEEARRLGWSAILDELGIEPVDLNLGSSSPLAFGLAISQHFLSADLVIVAMKAKTHRRFGMSGIRKSLLGAVSGTSSGYPKLAGHHRMLLWTLQQIEYHAPPILAFVDGVNGIEGDGPLAGYPTKSDFVVIGKGTRGPDIALAVEMGFDPVLVPLFLHPGWLVGGGKGGIEEIIALRKTSFDFLPPITCPWMYKSLMKATRPFGQHRREAQFQRLLSGAKECWPIST